MKLAQALHTEPSISLRHITAQQLLEALRDFTKEKCGGDAREYLNMIGIKSSADVGEIVFNLIGIGALAKTEKDSRADFTNSFDFEREFRHPGSTIWVNVWLAAVAISFVLALVFAARDLFRAFAR
jgi:uncharacterized repeat protein (TIGR04138 family)